MKKPIQLPVRSCWDINPDTLIFSDLHLHEREEFGKIDPQTGLNSRLTEGLSILDQIIKIKNDRPKINRVINLGDVFELKDRVPNHILTEYKKRINSLGYYTTLMGNHDYNLIDYPVLGIFHSNEKDKNFIDTPLFFPGDDWGFIPFQRKQEDFIDHLIKLNELNPKIIFFHQEIPGSEYESGKKVPGLFLNTLFKPGIVYISGHMHKYQTVNRVVYLGSPYQVSFAGEGLHKYIWLLNSETRNLSSMELDYPQFVTYHTEELNEDLNYSYCKGNYVRVVGEVESRLWTLEQKKALKEEFEKAGAKGVSLQITTKRQHQTKIKEEEVDNDELIIKTFSEENKGTLEQEKLFTVGWEIFNTN